MGTEASRKRRIATVLRDLEVIVCLEQPWRALLTNLLKATLAGQGKIHMGWGGSGLPPRIPEAAGGGEISYGADVDIGGVRGNGLTSTVHVIYNGADHGTVAIGSRVDDPHGAHVLAPKPRT